MKSALRTIIFSYISVFLTQYITYSIIIEQDSAINYHLFILGIALLYFFSKPILKILGLFSNGIGFVFMSFILTLSFVYILMTFVPLISITSAVIPDLKIFGFVLPSKELNGISAVVFVSLLIAVLYSFFDWLCSSKK